MSVTTVQPARSEQREPAAGRRRWIPIATGIGFTVSWVSGLVLPVPSLAPTASAAEIISKYGPHLAMVQAQFALTEGLPALGLAVVAFLLAEVVRRRSGSAASAAGAATGRTRARVLAAAGTVAAAISVAQYALGVMLAGWAIPGHAAGHASALWQALNRLDGVKMFALAVLATAAVALTAPGGPLPRWLRYASLALALSITVSGVAYLFLIQALTFMAYVAGVALLVWVTGMGLALGRVPQRAPGRARR
jgi:hypothetical protein